MEYEDDIIEILERFDVAFTSNLAKYNLSEKGLSTLYNCYM